jgi:hypothetical protein
MTTTTPTLRGSGFIQVAGRSRPFSVGTNQAYIFCQMDSQKQDGKPLPLPAYYDLFSDANKLLGGPYRDFLYSALAAGAERAGIVLDHDNLDVGLWMDDPDTDPDQLAIPFNVMLAQIRAKAEAQIERQKKAQGQPQVQTAPDPTEATSADNPA